MGKAERHTYQLCLEFDATRDRAEDLFNALVSVSLLARGIKGFVGYFDELPEEVAE